MSLSTDRVLSTLDDNLDASLNRLFELLRIPSISTDPAYAKDCRRAAEWLVKDLEAIGFTASIRDTTGHPMVVAHHPGPDAKAPHALFYGHYDVQPVDPIDLWDNDPFDPKIKEPGKGRRIITGRGSADDKGQLMTFVEACRAYKQANGSLPCEITILFEGEEESGSPSLKPFLEANAKELKADFALVCDTGMWDATTPAISTGLRGLVGEEITIKAADRDLHSGLYGGAAANPITILTKVLADMHDADGRVTIPGFYDGVDETPPEILKCGKVLAGRAGKLPLRYRPFDPVRRKGPLGPRTDLGPPDRRDQRHHRRLFRQGLQDGYRRASLGQSLVPPRASAGSGKNPRRLPRFRQGAHSRRLLGGVPRARLLAGHPALLRFAAAHHRKAALDQEWPNKAVMIAMGGSIPIVGDFQSFLGMESLLVGFGLPDDRIHSPNEKYELSSFHKGQRSWARILGALAEARAAGKLPG